MQCQDFDRVTLWLNSINMITDLSGTFITEDTDNDDICDLILTQDDAGNPAGVGNRVEIMTIESGHVRCQAMSSQEKAGALPSQQHILTGITVSLCLSQTDQTRRRGLGLIAAEY